MVRINRKRIGADHGDRDITIAQNLIEADQFLEIATVKDVFIESLECGGMRIMSKRIFVNGEIICHGPIVLAATEIHINNSEAAPM